MPLYFIIVSFFHDEVLEVDNTLCNWEFHCMQAIVDMMCKRYHGISYVAPFSYITASEYFYTLV